MRLRTTTLGRGAAAGLLATCAMTAFMIAAERVGVLPGQPPRMIVDRLLPGLREEVADTAALASHNAYGAAAGSALAVIRPRGGAVPGLVFGLALWAAGYEGWVPVIGVLPPAHQDRASRVLVMVLAHALYGSVLGALLRLRLHGRR